MLCSTLEIRALHLQKIVRGFYGFFALEIAPWYVLFLENPKKPFENFRSISKNKVLRVELRGGL